MVPSSPPQDPGSQGPHISGRDPLRCPHRPCNKDSAQKYFQHRVKQEAFLLEPWCPRK